MKKMRSVLCMIVIWLLFFIGCGDSDDPSSSPPRFTAFQETVAGLDTPSKVISYMQSNFTFVFHAGCISYSPEQFFNIKAGDCKDYSTFFSYILAQHGCYAEIVTFTWYDKNGIRNGHVVTIFRNTDGALKYQSNNDHFGPVSSVDDLLNREKSRLNASRMGGHLVLLAGTTDVCSPD